MNDIQSKAENARNMRKKFDKTWSQITPKLTIYGLVDETVGQMIKKGRSDKLVSTLAVTGMAWLFNTFHVSSNSFNFFKFTRATIKQETKAHENSNPTGKRSKNQSDPKRKVIGT